MKIRNISRFTDMDMRMKISSFSDEEKENLIQTLGVSHSVFNNWFEGRQSMGAKMRNKCLHAIGLLMNYEEFQNMVEA